MTALVMLGISLCCPADALRAKASNPIIQTSFTPDPAPVVFDDTLYVYTGCDREGNNDFYYMTGYQCFSTTDMQNWTNHGTIMEDTDFSWGKEDSAWASQCIERNGKYYFYVTMECKSGGGRGIGVAVADAWFPVIDPGIWKEESRSETLHDEETGYDFEFTVYIRK